MDRLTRAGCYEPFECEWKTVRWRRRGGTWRERRIRVWRRL